MYNLINDSFNDYTEQIIINIDSVTSETTAKYFMKQMSEWEMYL